MTGSIFRVSSRSTENIAAIAMDIRAHLKSALRCVILKKWTVPRGILVPRVPSSHCARTSIEVPAMVMGELVSQWRTSLGIWCFMRNNHCGELLPAS